MEDSQRFPELQATMKKITEKASVVGEHSINICKREKQESFPGKGISLLDVKSQLLLSYLTNVSLFALMKLEGRQVEDCPVVTRLIELRTVLEKIRPVDLKLKYQIDKLLKLASSQSSVSALDPLHARPNPGNLVSMMRDGSGESDGSGGESDGSEDGTSHAGGNKVSEQDEEAAAAGLYVPPRIAAVPYDDDKRRGKDRAGAATGQKYSLSRSMLQELKDEYWDGPEEQKDDAMAGRHRKRAPREEARTTYEEDHYMRLPGAKRKKMSEAGESTLAALDLEKPVKRSAKKPGNKKKQSFRPKRRR